MMEVIVYLNKKCQEVVAEGKPVRELIETGIFDDVVKMKYDVPNKDLSKFDEYYKKIDAACASID
jgi:V/A-type H+-transporting ATPase subunit A